MKILVVDDESPARARLRHVLADDLGQEVVAECANVDEARAAIEAWSPDAVFLDIEMPQVSGIELARELDAAGYPLVVFVTAYRRYAYEAFDVAPVDYVMKPVETVRCRRALRRLERLLDARDSTRQEPGDKARMTYPERIFVREDDRLVCLRASKIEAIEALGNYVKIRTAGKSHVVRSGLTSLEAQLHPASFVRTHRSHIVNVSLVRELLPLSHGDYNVVLESGHVVPLSRAYRDRLQMFVLGEWREAKSQRSQDDDRNLSDSGHAVTQ
jgi:two-component system, LytTR family, response regulator